MKKQLNVDSIQSELRGGSAFFPGYKSDSSPTPSTNGSEKAEPDDQTHAQVSRTVLGAVPRPVPLVPKARRVIKQRQPFDIYEDQYIRLKQIAGNEKEYVNGRSMSQMVRDAIDNYLKEHAPVETNDENF